MTERAIIFRATLPASYRPQDQREAQRASAASPSGAFVDQLRVAPWPYERIVRDASITPGFDRHCVAEFEHLALSAPLQLIHLAQGPLAHDSVSVAQIAGALGNSTSASAAVVEFLLTLLEHERAFVREGAIIGLASFLGEEGVRATLERVAVSDSSGGVREAAADVLALP